MQNGPRADVPEWNSPRRAATSLPDGSANSPVVWAISCFFFSRDVRRRGLSRTFLAEGIRYAREIGARVLEASPIDHAKRLKSVTLFIDATSTFRDAGFQKVARAKPGRPLMRPTF